MDRVESWTEVSAEVRAHRILAAYCRFGTHDQAQVHEEDLARLWRKAALLNPQQALTWWGTKELIGIKLRAVVQPAELATLWSTMPDRTAALHWWGSQDARGRALRRVVSKGEILKAWKAYAQQPVSDPLLTWFADSYFGRALRRWLPDGGGILAPAWREHALRYPEALLYDVWMASRTAQVVMARVLSSAELLDTWRRATAESPHNSFEWLETMPGEVRALIGPEELADVWRSAIREEPTGAFNWLDALPSDVKVLISLREIANAWSTAATQRPHMALEWFQGLPLGASGFIAPAALLPLLEHERKEIREQGMALLSSVG